MITKQRFYQVLLTILVFTSCTVAHLTATTSATSGKTSATIKGLLSGGAMIGGSIIISRGLVTLYCLSEMQSIMQRANIAIPTRDFRLAQAITVVISAAALAVTCLGVYGVVNYFRAKTPAK